MFARKHCHARRLSTRHHHGEGAVCEIVLPFRKMGTCVRQNNCVHCRYIIIASLGFVHNQHALRYCFQRDREVDESTPTNDLRMVDRELVPPLDLVMFQRVDVH